MTSIPGPTLEKLARQFGTDKAEHGYCPYYVKHFVRQRTMHGDLLEVGVRTGASLRMWEAWFWRLNITGVDINPTALVDSGRIRTIVSDVKLWTPDREFVVIIDDGSHLASDIVQTMRMLWPWVKPGGWYVIEDWATQWDPAYGGGEGGSPATAMLTDFVRSVLREQGKVSEIHLYGQIAFVRKAEG